MRAVTQTAPLRHGGVAWGSECAFPSRRGHRMRLCVSVRGQSALFRKVRFFSPGQTWRHLTEKRSLQPAGHGKAHSACGPSRKSALCTSDLTEKRTLHVPPHGKAHSGGTPSRKSALCMRAVTQNASLRHGGTAWGSECAFPSRRGHRMRLYVSVWGQNALFRKVRFFSPGQTRRRLTEKRILQPAGHGKAQSACALSRKSALCTSDLTEKRSLQLRRDRKAKSAFSKQKAHPTGERSRTLHRHGHATTRLPAHRTPVPQALRPEVHI